MSYQKLEKEKEAISALDIFKIGIGPSSSHTLGPWKAALRLLNTLEKKNKLKQVNKITVSLYGSLAKTGKGHGTDIAVLLGLCGENPVTFDTAIIDETIASIKKDKTLCLDEEKAIVFDYDKHLHFLYDQSLPFHPNALTFHCFFEDGSQSEHTYYSIGGGFVVQEKEEDFTDTAHVELPFPIENAKELADWCLKSNCNISALVSANEKAWRLEEETRAKMMEIWEVMKDCIFNGCHRDGTLPGGLKVTRRAHIINNRLLDGKEYSSYTEWLTAIQACPADFTSTLNWVSCFALAVNEENASFGRVVTAPTNGAAGVIPAVLMYLTVFHKGFDDDKAYQFLLCAAEIGSLFKKGATISAAMGGCQAEIGVSSAMAACAMAEVLGGSVQQCLMAAEIAMEHHLGLTCDPVGGLVQVPCIERNTMGAIKAITAAQLALQGDPGKAKVSLDEVIKTMWQTALDMNSKYKETSDGGLAVNIPISLSEC